MLLLELVTLVDATRNSGRLLVHQTQLQNIKVSLVIKKISGKIPPQCYILDSLHFLELEDSFRARKHVLGKLFCLKK